MRLPKTPTVKALRSIAQKLRWGRYRRRYDSDLANGLIAYESVFQEVLSDLHSGVETPPRLAIDFGWICDLESWEAEAWRGFGGSRNVRLAVGWWSEFQDVTNCVFRSCDMFSEIGNAAEGRFRFAELLDGAGDDEDSDTSNDPLRQEASCVTAEMALAMLVLHEIGHHALGHMELDELRHFRVRESDSHMRKLPSDAALLMQACEVEADRFSFTHTLPRAASGQSPFKTQLVSPCLRPHLFKLVILAYSLVIALLHTKGDSLDRYEFCDHPHPAVRLLASQFYVAESLGSQDDVVQAYLTGWRESLQVVQHNPNLRETLSLLVSRRAMLEEKIARLKVALDQEVRRKTKLYEFSSGEWIGA
jgi:hypothetical protein